MFAKDAKVICLNSRDSLRVRRRSVTRNAVFATVLSLLTVVSLGWPQKWAWGEEQPRFSHSAIGVESGYVNYFYYWFSANRVGLPRNLGGEFYSLGRFLEIEVRFDSLHTMAPLWLKNRYVNRWHRAADAGYSQMSSHRLHIPIVPFLIVSLIVLLKSVHEYLRAKKRLLLGWCLFCGYDNSQTDSTSCPECGMRTSFFIGRRMRPTDG